MQSNEAGADSSESPICVNLMLRLLPPCIRQRNLRSIFTYPKLVFPVVVLSLRWAQVLVALRHSGHLCVRADMIEKEQLHAVLLAQGELCKQNARMLHGM